MLDISKVPVVDDDVEIRSYKSLDNIRYIKLWDGVSRSEIYIQESRFNKYFKLFKEVLKNRETYRRFFLSSRGREWFKPRDIDNSLNGSDYFMVDRVHIYIEMFKHISKYKAYLDRDSLSSQNISVLEAVNKKIKRCKKLNKAEGSLYLNL